MDLIGIQKALETFNEKSLPELRELIDGRLAKLLEEANALLDRLDGTRINTEVKIPPKGSVR
jgi:hypothetical protein